MAVSAADEGEIIHECVITVAGPDRFQVAETERGLKAVIAEGGQPVEQLTITYQIPHLVAVALGRWPTVVGDEGIGVDVHHVLNHLYLGQIGAASPVSPGCIVDA
ncbi:hypothetical protein D3C77_422500 [compost metagenome]